MQSHASSRKKNEARKHLDHHNEENQQPPEPEPASPKKSDTSPGKKEKLKPKKPKKPPEVRETENGVLAGATPHLVLHFVSENAFCFLIPPRLEGNSGFPWSSVMRFE